MPDFWLGNYSNFDKCQEALKGNTQFAQNTTLRKIWKLSSKK